MNKLLTVNSSRSSQPLKKRKHLFLTLGKFRFVLLNTDDLKGNWTEHVSSAGREQSIVLLLFCFKEKKKVLHFRDVDFYFF